MDAVTPNAVGTPDFIKGPEEMADLVGRILAEKLAAQEREAAEAAAAQAALDAEHTAAVERAVAQAQAAPVPVEDEGDGAKKEEEAVS